MEQANRLIESVVGRRAARLGAAVVAATLGMSATARAQYPVDNTHVNDANNRIGSGGENQRRNIAPDVTPNDIVYGNVTGGRGFRAPASGDPREFRGPTVGQQVDRFTARSAGAPMAGDTRANNDLTVARPYYGDSRAVAPPAGYVPPVMGSSGYIPGASLTTPVNTPASLLPRPGELIIPGPVDARQQTLITASPVYGVRPWNPEDPGARNFLSNYTNLRPGSSADRFRLDDSQVRRMRLELQQLLAEPQGASGEPGGRIEPNKSPSELDAGSRNPAALATPELGATAMRTQLETAALTADTRTDQSHRQTLALAMPAQVTPQYAELRRRLQEYERSEPASDAESARRFQQLKQTRDELEAGKAEPLPGAVRPPAGTGDNAAPRFFPGAPAPSSAPTTAAGGGPVKIPAPLVISSLAEGVKAPGLAGLLRDAEKLMREGKYISALDRYDAALEVAPENPLIQLGKAHAELAAGYYARAESHLRALLGKDQALLLGRYDLPGQIGQDRLQFITRDLKEIAAAQPRQARAVLLLAYIAHNRGDDASASDWLAAASSRAGGGDALVKLFQHHWGL